MPKSKSGQCLGYGALSIDRLRAFTETMRASVLAHGKSIHCTRLVGKFGIAYALARMSLDENLSEESSGAEVVLAAPHSAPLADTLFSEKLYQIIIGVEADSASAFENDLGKRLLASGAKVVKIGRTGGDQLKIRINDNSLVVSAKKLRAAYRSGWEKAFEELA